jgi:DNA-binding NtrC family response regulator
VPFLAEEFMRRFGRKHGIRVHSFSDEAMRLLKGHHWPGNVRELQNVIERAVILCSESGSIEADHLGLTLSSPAPADAAAAEIKTGDESHFSKLAEMEKRHILAALERCKGNRTHAAKMLDISIRTLRNKLHEYNGTSAKTEAEEESVSDS